MELQKIQQMIYEVRGVKVMHYLVLHRYEIIVFYILVFCHILIVLSFPSWIIRGIERRVTTISRYLDAKILDLAQLCAIGFTLNMSELEPTMLHTWEHAATV